MHLVESFRPTAANYATLTEFFFSQCARSPVEFLRFVVRLYRRMGLAAVAQDKRKRLTAVYTQSLSGVCERFGLFDIKNRADTRAFLILEPTEYLRIQDMLAEYKRTA